MWDLKQTGESSGWLANLIQIATYFGLPSASAIVAWIIRDRTLKKRAQILLGETIKNLTQQIEQGEAREEALSKQLDLQAPRYWIANYERGIQEGTTELALSHLSKGFTQVHEDLREAMYMLARHYYLATADPDADSMKKAWYFSTIASVIRDDADVRLLRDGLREVDADIAKRAGAFNPSAAEWNEFESLPGFAAAKSDIRKLLQVMGARAHELANTGEVIKAQRIQARVTYIAGLHFGPTDSEMLTVRGNAAAISALARDWESVVTDAEFVVFHMTKQGGADSPKGQQMRHLLVAGLVKSGRLGEAKTVGESLLSTLEEDSLLAIATKALLNGRPASPNDQAVVGSIRGYYETEEGKRVAPPPGFPSFGGKWDS